MSAMGFMAGSAFDTHARIFRQQMTDVTGIDPQFTSAVNRS